MLEKIWRKGIPLTLLVGMQVVTAILETSVKVPQKVKIIATLWPSNNTTGYLPQRHRRSEEEDCMQPNVHSSIVQNSQTVEGAKMPFNRWMDKDDVVYIYKGILLNHQKGWIPTIFIDMNETGGDYAKWNKSSREKQVSYDFTHLWNIRNRKISRSWKGRMRWLNGGEWTRR